MDKATIILQREFIRLLKGMLKAWETWIDDKEGIKPMSNEKKQ